MWLGIVAGVGWLAVLIFTWALCRAAARADRWAEEERKRKDAEK